MSVHTRLVKISGTALVLALSAVGPGSVAQADALTPAPGSAVAPVAPPPPSTTLPVALDVMTPYEAQVSCDPRTQPGVSAFAALMTARYKTGVSGTNRTCRADTSEHYDGRALDWMLSVSDPQQNAVANSVITWLSAGNGVMARRFGISYIIRNKKMWREYAPERGWATYTGADPHTSHIHFSFSWDGAMKRTSWWTGRATTVVDLGPCRVYAGQFAPLYTTVRTASCPASLPAAPASPYPVYVIGQRNPQIGVAQRALGVTAGGLFDTTTFAALVRWQTRVGVPTTGVLDKATWARLVPATPAPAPSPVITPPVPKPPPVAAPWAATRYTPYKGVALQQGSRGAAVVVLQRGLRVTPDGAFGPVTRAALVAFQTRQAISPSGAATRLAWDRLERRDYPLIAYRALTVRQGATSAVVIAVQRALRVGADGVFGPITAAAVRAVQSRARLAPTGVVSGWTWVAIENQMLR
jgi:peptidoglycan hydrolase-like protein with peptidoglycan-binding domain